MPGPVVFALGSNGSGQLGVGHTDDTSHAERCIFSSFSTDSMCGEGDRTSNSIGLEAGGDVEVRKIVAGGNHTLLLTGDGRVFTAGRFMADNDWKKADACIVFEERSHAWSFTSNNRITDVAATWQASFVVVGGKAIWVCGTGAKGELGMGPDVQHVMDGGMRKVFEVSQEAGDGDAEIIAIEACMAHVVVLLSNGQLYGWGSCRKGQLGEDYKKDKILWVPTRIYSGSDDVHRLPFPPQKVLVGRDYTVFQRIGEKLVVWGDTKSFAPEDLEKPIRDGDEVTSGWSSIHIVSSRPATRSVQSVGKNDHGQLAPANLPAIRMLAVGSEHCVAITEANTVIAWGWGEHGNCGEQLDPKGNVAGRCNEIPLPGLDNKLVARTVAAGCATSFVVCGKPG